MQQILVKSDRLLATFQLMELIFRMFNLFSTVTKKVVIGYLVVVIFSLSAVGFALTRLHQQTSDTEHLVNVEFRTFELVRDLQQNLLAQENIEKQLLILRDPALSELRLNRNNEFTRYALALNRPPLSDQLKSLDWRARKAALFERVPDEVVSEVTARMLVLVDPE